MSVALTLALESLFPEAPVETKKASLHAAAEDVHLFRAAVTAFARTWMSWLGAIIQPSFTALPLTGSRRGAAYGYDHIEDNASSTHKHTDPASSSLSVRPPESPPGADPSSHLHRCSSDSLNNGDVSSDRHHHHHRSFQGPTHCHLPLYGSQDLNKWHRVNSEV